MSDDMSRRSRSESLLGSQRDSWRRGSPIRCSDLLTNDPTLRGDSELLQDLIYNEVLLRREAGESPVEAEYRELFPELQSEIGMLFQMDRGLDSILNHEQLRLAKLSTIALEPRDKGGDSNSTPMANPPTHSTSTAERSLQVAVGRGEVVDAVSLLRQRLLIVAVILACNYGLAFLQMPVLFFASDAQTHAQWAMCGLCSLIAWRLWRQELASMNWLRWIELALFAMTMIQLTMFLIERLWWRGDLLATLDEKAFFRGHLYNTVILCYFPVIVGYGIMVPNTGRRCFWVTMAMGCVPVALLLMGLPFYWKEIATNVRPYLHGVAWVVAWTTIGVTLASFGSNRIYLLQKQVDESNRYGPYQVGRQLGSGGMGVVYLAEHSLLKRPCAVKVIHPDRVRDPKTLARFEREVKATAQLKHPNSIEIYDYGKNRDGTFYYVMEYLPGMTLDQIVKRFGPIPANRVIHFLRQVCGPLQESHGFGLIHRDVKPSNIIASHRGGVADLCKLLDFGMVKDIQQQDVQSEVTMQGGIAGTPAFMSPEQAGGHASLDGRSDIYSLGSVGYYLLTATFPFAGTAIEVMAAHLYRLPKPIVELVRDVPEDVAEVVHRCLEKDPSRRFQTAGELQDRLEQLASKYPWTQSDALRWWQEVSEGVDSSKLS